MKRVYVASSWRNMYQPGIVAALRSAGLEVYDFRAPEPGNDGFRWSEIDGGWQAWTPKQWREALKHPVARRGYGLDRGGMDWADCCVLVLPSGRSAHMEAAFMAAQGKPVFTLALEKIEPDLMNLLLGPADHILTTMDELFDAFGVSGHDGHGDVRVEAPHGADAIRRVARRVNLERMHLCHRLGNPFYLESGRDPIPPGPFAESVFSRQWDDLAARLDARAAAQNEAPAQAGGN